MGCYFSKAVDRLQDNYSCWNAFISDLIAIYDNREVDFTCKFTFMLLYEDGVGEDAVYTYKHFGLVNSDSITTMRMQLMYFHAAPYYYKDDYMYFYEHVDVCKFCNINIVINV